MTRLHQGHGESVPAVEEIRIEFHTAAVLHDGTFEIAHGEVAVGIIEKVVEGLAHDCGMATVGRSEPDSARRWLNQAVNRARSV
jgi:hypothetical protein